jgi:hypothetical protein
MADQESIVFNWMVRPEKVDYARATNAFKAIPFRSPSFW